MNGQPLVTLVIITYQRPNYLRQAIKSALSQTYPNLEIIVSDNGSKDNTPQLMKEFSDSRICFRRNNENLPMAIHTNQCLSEVKGDYIFFLCDDDRISSNCIESLVKCFQKYPSIVLAHPHDETIDESGHTIKITPIDGWEFRKGIELVKHWLWLQNPLPMVQLGMMLMPTELIRSVGGYLVFENGLNAEHPTFIAMALQGDIAFSNDAIFQYRVHGGGTLVNSHYSILAKSALQLRDYINIDPLMIRLLNGLSAQDTEMIRRGVSHMCAHQYVGMHLGQMFSSKKITTEAELLDALVFYCPDDEYINIVPHYLKRWGMSEIFIKSFYDRLKDIEHYTKPSKMRGNLINYFNFENWISEHHKGNKRTQITIDAVLVTICIPTYNGEKFISDALSSALSQTYQNIEIIISDDGSTDRTLEIAKSFQNQTSKDFIIISHRNYGLVPNWNFCIQHAKGKYIKFLHQDDLLEPDCITELVKIAEQDDEIGLVFSARGILMAAGAENDPSCMSDYQHVRELHKSWTDLRTIQSGQKLLEDPNLFNWPINKFGEPTTVLIKKEVFDTIGGFDPELRQLVDVEMWLRIMSQYKIGFADKVLSHWRLHPEQQTRKNARERHTMSADWQKFYEKIAKDSRYPEKVRQEALRYLTAIRQQSDMNLRNERKYLAESWLKVPPEFLEKAYSGDMGNAHRKFMESNIRNETLSDEENAFFQQINSELVQRSSSDPASAMNYLLAIMLYLPSGRLKIENAGASLPGWLIADYQKFYVIQ